MAMKAGIRFKLVFFNVLLLSTAILIFSCSALFGIKEYLKTQNETILLNQKNLFEQYLNDKFSNYYTGDQSNFTLINGNIFDKPWLQVMPASLYSTQGKLLSGFTNEKSSSSVQGEDKMLTSAMQNKIAYKEISDTYYLYSPLKYKGNTVALLKLSYSVKKSLDFYNNVVVLFIIIGSIVTLGGAILGSIYMVTFTTAIKKISDCVQNIRNGKFKDVSILKRNDELGNLSKGVKYMSDTIEKSITDLEQEKSALDIALQNIKEMDKQQKEFFNNVTHEFKTPLTAIKAYADILSMYEYDPELMNQASSSISAECDRLKGMVDCILDLSRLEKYDLELTKNEVHIKPLTQQICQRMMGKAKKSNIELSWEAEDIVLNTDEDSIRYILINLIDNAIKYNKAGGKVRVCASEGGGKLRIEISDTGIGIPKKHLAHIFEAFYRVQDDRSRESGGTGLGLSFVKKLVYKLDGTITAVSEVGKGSVFSVVLPMQSDHFL